MPSESLEQELVARACRNFLTLRAALGVTACTSFLGWMEPGKLESSMGSLDALGASGKEY